MPKYLVTATAFRPSDENPGAFAPRTFSFEVSLAEPWNGKNSTPVGNLAFHECHRTFGFWPKHNPQIDSVVEVNQEFRDALLAIAELVSRADAMDTWDHIDAHHILAMIPDAIYAPTTSASADISRLMVDMETVQTEKPEDPADDYEDDLI